MKLGFTAFRATVGAVFFAHGAQKLFGWFGGPGLDGMAKGLEAMGLRPGRRNALIAGSAEAGGGTLLATGFLTPLGSAATIGVMTQAIRSVHRPNGFFVTKGGYEYNLTLIAAAVALADAGPGPLSLDRLLGTERSGTRWALAALAAGLAGPRVLERLAPSAATPPAPAPAPQTNGRREAAREPVGAAR
jgi:putative oxidoreductase